MGRAFTMIKRHFGIKEATQQEALRKLVDGGEPLVVSELCE